MLLGSAVLVTGNSYSVKDHLKQVGEGAWCKSLNGWVFPEHKRADVEAACKAAGATVETGQAVKAAPKASIDANATITVARHKKAVLVTGDTKLVKAQLGGMGGSWNGKLGGWILPGKSGGAVVALLKADPTNKVTTGAGVRGDDESGAAADSSEPPAAKKAKREQEPKVEEDDDDDDEEEEDDDDDDDDDDA